MDIETKVVNVTMTLPKVERLADAVFWGVVALAAVTFLISINRPMDDTDAPGERSGLRLHTDHGTGCQYLATRDGALSPRLGADGRQICQKED
ncbi:hypothetical protein [Kaistia granuli]|uniref:hypothetical protein n=1 Tax=Kaistia granuli TaxID=363259 RepID=UPI00037F94C6|nr:hypothetical protein [Kaistia granuli]